jgi:ubiquinone/menaquinone biosynthesis C-methylase UbiE
MNPAYSDYGFSVLFREAGLSYGSSGRNRDNIAPWLSQRHTITNNSLLLDIGCGDGAFLSTLPVCSKVGVDIDASSIERAKSQHPGMTFICDFFENIDINYDPDVITMFHVLEHLRNPLATLRRLHLISTSTTQLVVEVPVIEEATSADIVGFLTPQHLTHFSKSTLHSMLAIAGWNITECFQPENYNGYRIVAQKGPAQKNIVQNIADKQCLAVFLSNEYNAHDALEKRICKLIHKEHKKIVIWGAGQHTEAMYHKTSIFSACRDFEYIIVDSDPLKHNSSWRGIWCFSPNILPYIKDDYLLIISSYSSVPSILNAIKELSLGGKIGTLYDDFVVY